MWLSRSFSIDGRRVGPEEPCFVIAEAGVAHFGNYDKAFQLVDMAVESKADAVKFQIFDVDEMIARESQEWRDRLSSRALKREHFADLKRYCEERGIIFFATAHDVVSFEYLASLRPAVFKIGSGELGNWRYLRMIAEQGRPVIFSTGMYTMADVDAAVREMVSTGNRDIAILQCTTRYPTPPNAVNLRVMDAYRERFGGVVGYSDHTAGFHIPLAAVARGASVIEKHISIDFDVPNAQDWKVSCGPQDLARFIRELREVEQSLGSGEKLRMDAEAESMGWARKSLVALRSIPAGTVIDESMLGSKRPGTGIAPNEIHLVVGRETTRDVAEDEVLTWSLLK